VTAVFFFFSKLELLGPWRVRFKHADWLVAVHNISTWFHACTGLNGHRRARECMATNHSRGGLVCSHSPWAWSRMQRRDPWDARACSFHFSPPVHSCASFSSTSTVWLDVECTLKPTPFHIMVCCYHWWCHLESECPLSKWRFQELPVSVLENPPRRANSSDKERKTTTSTMHAKFNVMHVCLVVITFHCIP
jgi:hypothetical protein